MVAFVRTSATAAPRQLDRAERGGDWPLDELVHLARLVTRLQECARSADAAMAEMWRIADVLTPGTGEPTPEGLRIVHDLGPAPYVAEQLEDAWNQRAGPVRAAVELVSELRELLARHGIETWEPQPRTPAAGADTARSEGFEPPTF
jgi:hypothetical protein